MMSWQLKRVLDGVAARVREVRLWNALSLCWLGWTLVGVLLILVGVHSIPILLTVGLLAAVSAGACIVIAMRSVRDPRVLARRIEAAHPDLDAGLLAAVEDGTPGPLSRMGFLQETVVARVLEHHRAHDWNQIVSERALYAARFGQIGTLCGLAAVAMALAVQASSPAPAAPESGAAARVVKGSEVEVTPGDTEIEKGTSLLVVARFPGSVPPEVRMVVTGMDPAAASQLMTRSLEDPTFAGRVESVATDLSYRIEYTGGNSASYRVRVFENPELLRTDARLEFPSYTGLESRTIEDVRHVTAVEGTGLRLQFRLNKEVASAKLLDEKGNETVLDPPAARAPSEKQPVYTTALTMTDSHRYMLQLVDREGRKNKLSATLGVNVTRNQPPAIAMTQPGRDVRVSPVEELRLKSQIRDDFGVLRHGIRFSVAGAEPTDLVLSDEARPRPKQVQLDHLIAFESLKAVPDQLVTYFVWAEDFGPDGTTRRTEGDMFFAEVRHFEEIFRQGEQPSGSAENEQDEQQGGGNARQAEQLAELQKEVINGTWKVLRRESGRPPTEKLAPDAKVLRESQESVITRLQEMDGGLEDAASKASLERARKAMGEAVQHLKEASEKGSVGTLPTALAAEQVAYQALLKLRAREFQVVRNNSRQRGGGGGASSLQRQLDQLELTNREDRFEEQSRAKKPLSPKEQEQQETRQVLSRLKELAQRQADLNDRLRELQAALQAAKEESARQEIQRQLKRLREQQQQILRDTDELQERMENEQNRDRMAENRQQVQDARDHVRQASEALEQGRVPQALTEGTRAGQQLDEARDALRKRSSNQFADELTAIRNQARQLAEEQERLSGQLDALKQSARQSLRDSSDREQLKRALEEQTKRLEQLLEQMRRTVGDAEESEPLLARNLFDAVRKTEEQKVPEAMDQTRKLAEAGFAEEASQTSRQAGEGIDALRQGVERAARSILGDETAALRLAQNEVEELANQINREIARATGEPRDGKKPGDPSGRPSAGQDPREQRTPGGENARDSRPAGGRSQPEQDASKGQPEQGQNPERQPRQRGGQGDRDEPAQRKGDAGGQPGEGRQQGARQGEGRDQGQPQDQGKPGASPADEGANESQGGAPAGGPGGSGGNPRSGGQRSGGDRSGADRLLEQLAGNPNGSGGPITGEGFREWSDRMRDVEELLEDPNLRSEAARIRDRARGTRDAFKRHSQMPDWTKLKETVADPIHELHSRIVEEIRRRESPDSLVPIDRDPVPPRYAQGVRRYYERLGSGQ